MFIHRIQLVIANGQALHLTRDGIERNAHTRHGAVEILGVHIQLKGANAVRAFRRVYIIAGDVELNFEGTVSVNLVFRNYSSVKVRNALHLLPRPFNKHGPRAECNGERTVLFTVLLGEPGAAHRNGSAINQVKVWGIDGQLGAAGCGLSSGLCGGRSFGC